MVKEYKRSKETRDKMSKSHTGKILSDDHKKSISSTLRGRKRSPETREKISNTMKGKVTSEETKQKMSIAKLGKPSGKSGKKLYYDEEGNKKWITKAEYEQMFGSS